MYSGAKECPAIQGRCLNKNFQAAADRSDVCTFQDSQMEITNL